MDGWPATREELEAVQRGLAVASPPEWHPPAEGSAIGAVFVAFSTELDPSPEERGWAAATVAGVRVVVRDEVRAPYEAGYLALREGPLLERAVRSLDVRPDVLLVNASGRDHPRGAGLALHLGAVLDLPTVGVTDRPLVAAVDGSGGLILHGQVVGRAVTCRTDTRPVIAHAAWRTDPEVSAEVVLAASGSARTPEPLRLARFFARSQRARDEGRLPSAWRMDQLDVPRFPTAG